jgi:hypothetical protein
MIVPEMNYFVVRLENLAVVATKVSSDTFDIQGKCSCDSEARSPRNVQEMPP